MALPAFSEHGTLIADTVTTVTAPRDVSTLIVKAAGVGVIYGNVGGPDPTVGGAGTFRVDAPGAQSIDVSGSRSLDVVKLISSGTPEYSVEGY